ncbi:MAG: hypothetical protein AB9866_02935 [Syntrophobacteraceae bacterium]
MSSLDLIRFITRYATQSGITLTTVRLVKFVYLADLYFARANNGSILTAYPWAFVYYGPYCSEVMRDLDKAVTAGRIERAFRESKFSDKDYQLFSCRDSEADKLEDLFPVSVVSPLKRAIRKYGDDTQALLDHVYFETEPMEDVKKGDLLDFSKARALSRPKLLVIPKPTKKQVESGRRQIAGLVEKMKKGKERLRKDSELTREFEDELFYDALKVMDGEDLETGLKGTAGIE